MKTMMLMLGLLVSTAAFAAPGNGRGQGEQFRERESAGQQQFGGRGERHERREDRREERRGFRRGDDRRERCAMRPHFGMRFGNRGHQNHRRG